MATGTVTRNKSIVTYDHEFTATYTSGTIGSRGGQDFVESPYPVDKLIGISIIYIASSNEYNVLAFRSSATLYCNFYRASTNAVTAKATVRFTYAI